MKFTEDWTKEDNDKYRQLIKEKKSISEIISIFGIDKLRKNSKGKFISNFSDFLLKEIKFSAKNVIYSLEFQKSLLDNTKTNYVAHFKSDKNNEYIVDFIYIKDNIGPYTNEDCYNISFTILDQHDISDEDIYERETGEDEVLNILPMILFIIDDICKVFKIKILIVGLTKSDVKNQLYLDMIKSMNKKYILGASSINNGNDVYYIEY
jgi:hypothetical protein